MIGDASAPVQRFEPPPVVAEPEPEPAAVPAIANVDTKMNNRQSVDWYGGLAADTYPSPTTASVPNLATMAEEDEEEVESSAPGPAPLRNGTSAELGDSRSSEADGPEADFDMSTCEQQFPPFGKALMLVPPATRVRSLYAYEGQREQDATFQENLLIVAHPPKDSSSDWLYGVVPATGSRGWLPKTYVEELRTTRELVHDAYKLIAITAFNTPAKVLYDYEGQTEDELSVKEGMSIFIGDKVDSDWARAVLDGRVGLVPLAYVEESQ